MFDELLLREFSSACMEPARLSSIAHLLERVQDIPGEIVDIGCGTGLTAAFFQFCQTKLNMDKEIHCYDAFPIVALPVGDCTSIFNPDKYPTNSEIGEARVNRVFRGWELPPPKIHSGWLIDTLPEQLPDQIAFAHIDVEFYVAMLESLIHIYPRLSPGAICVVDDYGLGYLPCIKRAVDEFLKGKPETMTQTVSGIQAIFVKHGLSARTNDHDDERATEEI